MLSFIKKLFSNKKQEVNIIKQRKWTINSLKVYIAPLKFAGYVELESLYRDMVVQAFNVWANASGGVLKFEITNALLDSNINIEWKKVDKKALGHCYFNYDNQGRLYSAEIAIGLFPKRNENLNYNAEIYHTILHCIGIALGLPQTNNTDDIMCIPHQYGKIELSENDKKAIYDLYRELDPEIQAFMKKVKIRDRWDFIHYYIEWKGYYAFVVGMDASSGAFGPDQVVLLRDGEERYATLEERNEILGSDF